MSLQKVKPGDPLRIPASTWNTLVDAAQDYLGRQHDQGNNGVTLDRKGMVLVKNASGVKQPRFSALAVTDVLFGPSDNLTEFKNNAVLVGTKPTWDLTRPFVILDETLDCGPVGDKENGLIGRAFAYGVCPVQIDVTDESHLCATTSDGVTANLVSADYGVAQILWKETGTGVKWAMIRFTGTDAVYNQKVYAGFAKLLPPEAGVYPGYQNGDRWVAVVPCLMDGEVPDYWKYKVGYDEETGSYDSLADMVCILYLDSATAWGANPGEGDPVPYYPQLEYDPAKVTVIPVAYIGGYSIIPYVGPDTMGPWKLGTYPGTSEPRYLQDRLVAYNLTPPVGDGPTTLLDDATGHTDTAADGTVAKGDLMKTNGDDPPLWERFPINATPAVLTCDGDDLAWFAGVDGKVLGYTTADGFGWVDANGLPDTSGSHEGDVLTLDVGLNPVWQDPRTALLDGDYHTDTAAGSPTANNIVLGNGTTWTSTAFATPFDARFTTVFPGAFDTRWASTFPAAFDNRFDSSMSRTAFVNAVNYLITANLGSTAFANAVNSLINTFLGGETFYNAVTALMAAWLGTFLESPSEAFNSAVMAAFNAVYTPVSQSVLVDAHTSDTSLHFDAFNVIVLGAQEGPGVTLDGDDCETS